MNEEIVVGIAGRIKAVVNDDDDSMQFVTFRRNPRRNGMN